MLTKLLRPWQQWLKSPQIHNLEITILICPCEPRKEGKPHGIKTSLKNRHGAGPAINNRKLPSLTHPKKISQVSEGLLS